MKKIVIASVLKPVDDVRSYWKIAQSLAKTNKYGVNIIGIQGKKHEPLDNIHFHPHLLQRNQWIKRFLIRFRILLKIIRIRPNILVINTHELIFNALLAKLFLGTKLIYDVQENYVLNILLKRSIPRIIYSKFVQFKESIGKSFFDHFWLAEKCYLEELSFDKNKASVVENKAYFFPQSSRKNEPLRMLFSGTISDYSGAREAMNIMKRFSSIDPSMEGVIIGQVHDPELKDWLRKESEDFPTIQLNISSSPIPHPEILSQISWANLGLISYQENQANRNKVPTKLYEYSRYQLPYLVQKRTSWTKIGASLGGAIPTDFNNPNLEKLIDLVKNRDKLFPNTFPEEATWESESIKLLNSIDNF